jgi:hypothetical protein
MAEDDVSLVGTLEKIVYSNPENGFLIVTIERLLGESQNLRPSIFDS